MQFKALISNDQVLSRKYRPEGLIGNSIVQHGSRSGNVQTSQSGIRLLILKLTKYSVKSSARPGNTQTSVFLNFETET